MKIYEKPDIEFINTVEKRDGLIGGSTGDESSIF